MQLCKAHLSLCQILSRRSLEVMIRLLFVNGNEEAITMYDAEPIERFTIALISATAQDI